MREIINALSPPLGRRKRKNSFLYRFGGTEHTILQVSWPSKDGVPLLWQSCSRYSLSIGRRKSLIHWSCRYYVARSPSSGGISAKRLGGVNTKGSQKASSLLGAKCSDRAEGLEGWRWKGMGFTVWDGRLFYNRLMALRAWERHTLPSWICLI